LADFDRPLNSRGEAAAPFMGRFLKSKGVWPDVILASPAVRARQTAQLFAEAAGSDSEILFDDRIYEASTSTLLKVAGETPDNNVSVMLVGHNPGTEGLVRVLTGQSEPMATAAIAI